MRRKFIFSMLVVIVVMLSSATITSAKWIYDDLTDDRFFAGKGVVGAMGTLGAGVGVAPSPLPTGMVPMTGWDKPSNDNYGNYQYADGSIMVFIPKFYYKVEVGTNNITIKGKDTYATTALANAAGFALHRAFIDGGVEKSGFFIDKYKASKTAWGTGYIGSSIKNGNPISTAAAHNPIADLTAAAATNNYAVAVDCAKARDGVNGAVNANSIFHVASRFQFSAIAMLSLAHGQASASTAVNAWYNNPSSSANFPKGCNNNVLQDINDTAVVFESDGYSNACKTGSAGYGGGAGNLFAKTAHNGQANGVVDINGGMYEISLGITAVATTVAIAGMSQANPCEVTWTAHGLSNGNYVQIGSTAITQADWVGASGKIFTITKTGDNTFTLDGFNASGFGTPYDAATDPGTMTKGTFYVAKEATAMKSFTSGASGATDHWGATGVAAMMDAFVPAFDTTYPNNAFLLRMGSGTNQVISEATSGAGWVLAGLGFPKDAGGIDASGSAAFGLDYYYQFFRDQLCLLSFYTWNHSSGAGVWASSWSAAWSDSYSPVGFRCATYGP